MARIKGGMNAKKKHNRTLKLAKGYRGARSKQICRKKAAQTSDETALDRTYQCCGKNERSVLQQIYAWPEAGKR